VLKRLWRAALSAKTSVGDDFDAPARSPRGVAVVRRWRTPFRPFKTNGMADRRAAAAHGQHEQRTGQRDENWPE